ncbi:MAG: F0F1 ATP synthase subunit A [Cyclobacteriaceae bacterium]|jgi:F-type H+-transporting ATPase subunit a|nr:F0F1 ATP synthase subunit A [Cyclobacteriaceae bacterium]
MSAVYKRIKLILLVIALIATSGLVQSAQAAESADSTKAFNASEVILHHVLDDHIWHFFDGHYGTWYLPIIVYTKERGLESFSSHHFYNENHEVVPFNGYKLDHNHIYLEATGEQVLDLSITKNVATLFINAIILLLVFTAVARGYKNNAGKAPKGIQAFIEPIIVFVRDEVVKPNVGPKYEKFLPYLLTLFFFILFGNLLGLLPGASNLTGNIAVTATLAIGTFIITNLSGNAGYWGHIFWTPGVPLPLRPIILLVEVAGIITKPISLALRLFVAITAGHIVLLSLICLTFIFGSIYVGVGSSLIIMFINLIELLVAGIQAYVFTLFSSLYIGMAIAEHHHDDHH